MKTNNKNNSVNNNSVNNNKEQFAAINQLRRKVETLVEKSYSLNQAVKALQGIAAEEELAALGLESFAVKKVVDAWSSDLKVTSEEGKEQLALYVPQVVTVTVTDPETGEPKEVNVYERKDGKKGVSFKALKVRVLSVPEKWTPSIIIEGLVQSRELELAKLEAEVSIMHRDNVLRSGAYRKVTEKDAETGTTTTSFVKVEA